MSALALRLHEAADDDHHVLSALGAWLLLAVAAPAVPIADPDDADGLDELSHLLGADVASARRWAGALLADPHPAVHAALAVWFDPRVDAGRIEALRLPTQLDVGPLPDQAGIDRWVGEHTLGLIATVPVPTDTVVALVSALALDLTWPLPLAPVPSARLVGPFAELVDRCLASSPFDRVMLVDTARLSGCPDVGIVAAVRAEADGLAVWSVIADAGVPRAPVIEAAFAIARAPALVLRQADAVWDVPTDEDVTGRPWTVVERQVPAEKEGDRSTHGDAYLPAWSTQTDRALAVGPLLRVVDAVRRLVAPEFPAHDFSALQTACARYTSEGFSAAAVTMVAVGGAAPVLACQGVNRTLTARFGHPYACVAVVDGQANRGGGADDRGTAWQGLPLFSAWVAEPHET